MTMSQAAFSIQGRKPKRVKTRSLWQIGIEVSDLRRTIGVDVVGRHDLLEPEDVVGRERPGDAGGGGQVPAGVALDGDRHAVADRLADVGDDGDAAGEVVVRDAVAEGAGGGDRTPDGDRLALAAGAGEGGAELVEGPDLHRGDALGEEVGGELAGAALVSQASRSGYFP